MERYTSLYRLPENQYTAGSPVLLEAGALLKDSRTGAVLVQLKMRSVSVKPIRAVMVAVDAFDVSGAPLEGVAEYQYLDLSVPRDEPFGQHQAIVLPDANTRRASVRCTRVVFADGTSWEADPSAVWSPLPERTTLGNWRSSTSAIRRRARRCCRSDAAVCGAAPAARSTVRKKRSAIAAAFRWMRSSPRWTRLSYASISRPTRKRRRKKRRSFAVGKKSGRQSAGEKQRRHLPLRCPRRRSARQQ